MTKTPKKPRVVFLAEHMADAGVSDKELASALDVDRVTVTRWRNRERKVDISRIEDIASALRRRAIELYSPPKKISLDALVADLDDATRRQAADLLTVFLRQRD